MKELRERVELNTETLPKLLGKLYKFQNQVIVKLEGGVILEMLELVDLNDFLVTKVYPYVTVVSKSYGYELEVPTSIER